MMMSVDWWVTSADDVAVMTSPRADVSRRKLARAGTWKRMATSGSAWRSLEARDGVWNA